MCLRRGKITYAGLLLITAWAITDVVGQSVRGYWLPTVQLSYMLDVVLAALVLHRRWLIPYTLVLIAIYDIITWGSQLLPVVDASIAPPNFERQVYILLVSVFLLAVLILMTVIKSELSRQISVLKETINKLQDRIAENDQAKQALQASEARYRLVSSLTSDYTFSSRFNENGDLEHLQLSGAFEKITGYSPDEYIAVGGWRAVLYPDDYMQDDLDIAMLQRNQRIITEVRIIKKGGEVSWVRVYAQPVWDSEKNRLVGIEGAVQDITERKQAEIALQRGKAHLRALLNATTDVAFLISVDGTVLTLNKTFADSMGQSIDQITGNNVFDLLRPELRSERRRYFDDVIKTRQPVRWEDAGTEGWWDNSIYPILSVTGQVEAFAVYSRQITEQKRLAAELQRYNTQLEEMVQERTEQLARAKQQIESILHNTTDALALIQPNGDIQTKNPAFEGMFGNQIYDCIERILWTIKGDDRVEVVGSALVDAIYAQENRRVEAQIVSHSAGEQDIDLSFIPVQSSISDESMGILVSAHDITHLKEVERFKERFVDNVLHDLAAPITGLSTRLYILRKTPEKLDTHVSALEHQVEHLRNLLSDLRMLSELDRDGLPLDLGMCNLNTVVVHILDTYEPVAFAKDQHVIRDIESQALESKVDVRQIERVLVNLISNAINYTPNGKTIRVQTLREYNHFLFSVTDEGIGIDAIDQARIFERFYRTDLARRTHASGTGLGLSITKEIVERHKGTLTVASELGRGSTFTIRLPLKDSLRD
jgi:PAS domain S-box-containing protein